jgi:2-polyprenyl-3-methyl-5-hydroxy-6-metoxy-1,4-benzoquinol methylase
VELINEYLEKAAEKLEKQTFDFVIISCLLHEIENVTLFLEKIHSLVNKDTIVHIDVPNAYSFHRVLAYEMEFIESIFDLSSNNMKLQQQVVYDLQSLKHLMENNGFEIVDSGSYFIKPFTHNQMADMINSKIINEDVLLGLDKMIKYFPEMGSEIYVNLKLK